MRQAFNQFATATARLAGHPFTFLFACAAILAWAAAGPPLRYSENWQLTVNTATTIVTFLMVFLIQNSQNRESCSVQIKLDELIRATHEARNSLLDLENLSEEELAAVLDRYREIAKCARGGPLPGDAAKPIRASGARS
jgi:low affinity Fe/Cu permease